MIDDPVLTPLACFGRQWSRKYLCIQLRGHSFIISPDLLLFLLTKLILYFLKP